MDSKNLLKYPIGTFNCPNEVSMKQVQEWISTLKSFPDRLSKTVLPLEETLLNTPYREGAWTIRQLVHHLADSHLHSYVRFKWTLSENHPTIKAYDENAWSAMIDAQQAPIEVSLNFLNALYPKWIYFLETLKLEDFQKTYVHPEGMVTKTLFCTLGSYVWHGEHHLSQIIQKLES